ncbi:MAG: biotin/lipoyl-binding protein [Fidelibacterota bacterium]|nr:MAG: biotin/lipoyl-binding protein [Candidatus Neomarinimicrobiota bacterium]
MIFKALVADREIQLKLRVESGKPIVELQEYSPQLDLVKLTAFSYSLLVDGQSHHLSIQPSRNGFKVDIRRRTYHVRLQDELDITIAKLGLKDASLNQSGKVVAPIPGLVTSVNVATGDKVGKGDHLLVLEAMKMENEIRAPLSGKVTDVHISPGDTVEKGVELISIKGREDLK